MIRNMLLGAVYAAIALVVFTFLNHVFAEPESHGIYLDEDRNTSYIAGEACTINTPIDLTVEELYERAEFCAYKHSLWRQLLDADTTETNGVADESEI